jgi:hypothetical protein
MGSKSAITTGSVSASIKASFSNRTDDIEFAEQFVLPLADKKSSLQFFLDRPDKPPVS